MIEGRSIENPLCQFIEWDSRAGLKSIAASHMSQASGSLARHTGNAPTGTGCVRAPLDTQYLYANATARAVEGDLGGFLRVARMRGHGRNGNRAALGNR